MDAEKTPKTIDSKKGRRGGGKGGEKISSSFEFDYVIGVSYAVPTTRSDWIKRETKVSKAWELNIRNAIIQKIDIMEEKWTK